MIKVRPSECPPWPRQSLRSRQHQYVPSFRHDWGRGRAESRGCGTSSWLLLSYLLLFTVRLLVYETCREHVKRFLVSSTTRTTQRVRLVASGNAGVFHAVSHVCSSMFIANSNFSIQHSATKRKDTTSKYMRISPSTAFSVDDSDGCLTPFLPYA